MANVLTKFLVGIGWETKEFDAGTRKIESSFGGVKNFALAVGAGIAAALAGGTAIAINASRQIDQLNLKTQNLNTGAGYAYNLGNALKLVGGNADDALSAITGIEDMLTNLRLKGDIGALGDLPMAGINPARLEQAGSAQEFLSILAEETQGLDNQQLQLVQKALGLSDAMMKALGGGPQQFESLIDRAAKLTGDIEGMSESSRELQLEMARFGLIMDGASNVIAGKFMGSVSGLISKVNNFLEDNRGAVESTIDTVSSFAESDGGELGRFGPAALVAGGIMEANKSIYQAARNNMPGLSTAQDFVSDIFGVERGMSGAELMYLFADESRPSPVSQPSNTSPVKSNPTVTNNIDLKVTIDGPALEAKITEVTERVAYETVEDLTPTTVR